ncbi:hypothetical protein [Paenibacillus sp. USDA918EY]|uniref:hypothetical protein n=1 Tax=Paenibacillus sp. USDA918EY TaxID=2689575 RepID=UPI001F3A8337|nr:hypothetical protein [Paenibacillus sp. USDA918EY]
MHTKKRKSLQAERSACGLFSMENTLCAAFSRSLFGVRKQLGQPFGQSLVNIDFSAAPGKENGIKSNFAKK